jgi:hypothetical protein
MQSLGQLTMPMDRSYLVVVCHWMRTIGSAFTYRASATSQFLSSKGQAPSISFVSKSSPFLFRDLASRSSQSTLPPEFFPKFMTFASRYSHPPPFVIR